MRRAILAFLLAVPLLLLNGAAVAQQAGHDQAGHNQAQHDMTGQDMADGQTDHQHPTAEQLEAETDVGVDEHLGSRLPLDTAFTDENGLQVTLGQVLSDAPAILVPIYLTCPSVCNILQSTMVDVAPKMNMTPGKDYQVVFVSFDEFDTPEMALKKKQQYMTAMGGRYPARYWRYLLGDHAAIMKVVDKGLGFHFKRSGEDFIHPVILTAVGTDGMIARYLYGERFLPFDLTMAATEAGQGRTGLSVKRVLSYCFTYDAESKAYAFNFLRVTAAVVILLVVGLFLALVLAGRKKRGREG